MIKSILFLFILLNCFNIHQVSSEINGRRHIVYCPCMGRFGNQAEQLLGTLLFAKALNRTLVLPPFIHYDSSIKPQLVAFDKVIKVEPIKLYHDVILLEDFLNQHPEGISNLFCYSGKDPKDLNSTCGALEGEPFKTFWNSLNVSSSATQSIFYRPLKPNPINADKWKQKYSNFEVIAFIGSPSSFPAPYESIKLQKYIELSDDVKEKALTFRRHNDFLHKPYASVHLRHGPDWRRACELLINNNISRLFSSSQCTGLREYKLEHETCLPPFELIGKQLYEKLEQYREQTGRSIELVYVATDSNDDQLLGRLKIYFPNLEFLVSNQDSTNMDELMKDIYLMTHSDMFIGNCISSFSAFPARLRSERYHLANATFYFGQNFDEAEKETKDEL